ncbi:hypothetical protein NUACC21_58820 [Scytonema sp. NUACC21]
MSYVSVLKNIPEFLSQPTGIAAIASLGLHGAIAFLMPLMPVESNSKQAASKTKTVGLVELNQSELNRLPQTGTPQIALPTQASILPQVPPANLLPQSNPTLPPLPPPTAANNWVMPPLPNSTNVAIAPLPKSQPLKIASRSDLQFNSSLSPQVKPFPRFQEKVSLGEAKPLDTSPVPYNVPPIQPANVTQQQEMINNSMAPVAPYQMPESTGGNTATPSIQANPELANLPNVAPKPLTPLGELPKAGDNTVGTQNIEQLPQQEFALNVPRLPSPATREMSDKTNSSTDRFLEVKAQYPNIETRLPISATVNAKPGQEGNVNGDLVINSEGQVESIKFRDESISSDLKTAARQYFRQYFQSNPVQANGKPKFYQFNIAFTPNSNVRPETIQEFVPPSQRGSVQASSESQRNLIQRLRSPKLNLQLSQEPKQENLSRRSRLPEVNSQVSSKEPPINLTRGLRTQDNQPASVTPANPEVALKRTQSVSAATREEQTSSRQVVIKQPAATPQNDREQTSSRQVVIKQPAPTTQVNEEQASQPQEATSNQSSASSKEPSKLIRQLRQIREQRQNSNQESR